ncbi:threonine-rich protein [Calliphora vicina]|uniref:threonine-rich protein n=1 Tax=Calliphora vicina TaxID=7373 RepID=UPI00325AF71D
MNSLVINFILACALLHVACGVYPMSPQDPQNLAHLFFRSRLASQDPAVSMACFSNYIVRSNEVSEAYGRDYNQCLLDAKAGRQAIEAEMVDKRIAIGDSSQAICKRLSTCDGLNSTLEVFNCHARIGANNTKAVYSISGNASEYANVMQEKYRIIDLRHEQCCKTSERSYVEATAANYRSLQDCLDGRVKPNPPTTTSTTTTTTTTTTPQPTTTTTTTLAPVSSTTELEIPDPTTSEAPEVVDPTLLPGTEEFAKLLKLFK